MNLQGVQCILICIYNYITKVNGKNCLNYLTIDVNYIIQIEIKFTSIVLSSSYIRYIGYSRKLYKIYN